MGLLETSKTVYSLKILRIRYCFIRGTLRVFYNNSSSQRLIREIFDKTKIFLRYSSLLRITEIKNKENLKILSNSITVNYWKNLFKINKESLAFANINRVITLCASVETGSIIVFFAVTVNVILSLILRKEIYLFGWVIRGALLFLAIIGFSCNIDWQTLKNSSAVLRLIRKD